MSEVRGVSRSHESVSRVTPEYPFEGYAQIALDAKEGAFDMLISGWQRANPDASPYKAAAVALTYACAFLEMIDGGDGSVLWAQTAEQMITVAAELLELADKEQ